MKKATFRLPEWQMQRLRQRSREAGRSLNSVVAEVIAEGLDSRASGDQSSVVARALGSLLLRPARPVAGSTKSPPSPVRLTDALEWTRDAS